MIFTVARKELKALFASPLAWVVLTFMQIIRSIWRSSEWARRRSMRCQWSAGPTRT